MTESETAETQFRRTLDELVAGAEDFSPSRRRRRCASRADMPSDGSGWVQCVD